MEQKIFKAENNEFTLEFKLYDEERWVNFELITKGYSIVPNEVIKIDNKRASITSHDFQFNGAKFEIKTPTGSTLTLEIKKCNDWFEKGAKNIDVTLS